tara:strand:- start:48840 stop:50009 length:1170 start_codon:yes stop_codon:yes gene_type:complete
MHIVHSITDMNLSSGGTVRAIIDVSSKLADRGHSVTILTYEDSGVPVEWRDNPESNPRTVTLGEAQSGGMRATTQQQDLIAKTIAQADIVHAHAIWEPLTKRVSKAARSAGVPYIVSLHGMLDDWCIDQRKLKKLAYLKLGGTAMLNKAAAIQCNAEGELAQSEKWFSGPPGIVIPNLLNLEPYETMPGEELARSKFPMFDTGDPVLLFLSRIHYKKGIEHLIEAIKVLKDSGNPHRLLIAGDGDKVYESKLKALVKKLDLEDHIAFLGMVTGDAKISLYQAADLFVLSTSQENFGFVLYESLAAGTPIVTTKGVDTWPELQERAQAVICDQTKDAFASAIQELTSDLPALNERGRLGRQWIFEEMHPDQIIGQFESMYSAATRHDKGK